MPRGEPVPIMGIWLDCEGEHAKYVVVRVLKDGKWYEAIRELRGDGESTFSHSITEHGLAALSEPVPWLPDEY